MRPIPSPLAIVLLGLLLAACLPPPAVPPAAPETPAPAAFPEEFYRRAVERGEPVYRIVPERSLAIVYVYRGGTLARFGHDHVVASHDVRGYLVTPGASGAGRADLYLPLASLTVDEPALRAQTGFATQPTEDDIAGTRRNMLDKVLEAGRYPFMLVHVREVPAGADAPVLSAEVSLHGVTRALRIPVELEKHGDGGLGVRGGFALQQTDFGMTPLAVLGGALRTEDRVDVRFELRAVAAR